jgi:hypothetical protein
MGDETALFALPSKPGLCPESPDWSTIAIEQQGVREKGVLRDGLVGAVFPKVPLWQNCPFSAQISDLRGLTLLSGNSFGNVVNFPLPSKPRSCFDQPESPGISAGRELVSGKWGVLASASREPSVEHTSDEDMVRSFFCTALQKTEGIRYGNPSFILKIYDREGATCPDQPVDTSSWLLEELSMSYTPATGTCFLRLSRLETWF